MPIADIILKNANIITMEARQPVARLVAITGNRISLVGGDEGLEQIRGPGTKVVDCRGKTVLPGFNDAHCHIFSYLRKLLGLDLSPPAARSIADIKEVIHRQAQIKLPGTWISGTGFNEFYLAEKRFPNRWDIDEVAPDHPVVLSHRSLHACVLNGRALSLAGISNETPEPPGALISRDLVSGEPDGILYEMLGYIREKVMPPPTEEELSRAVKIANDHYLSLGITSLQEATVTNDAGRWQIYKRFKETGKLKSRVSMMLGYDAMNQFNEAGLGSGVGDEGLCTGAVKIIIHETTGRLYPSQTELNRQMLTAHKAGYQVALHAIEPNTLDAALTALEYIKDQPDYAGRRHRIEHCGVCPPSLLDRLSKLSAVVVSEPAFVYYNGERYLSTVPPDHLLYLYRIKSLLDRGIVVSAGSDSPIVPDSPLMGVYAAVTRRAESGQRVLSEESISVKQALELYTVGAAYASHEEKIKGSIAPGKLADMVVLSGDPTCLPPEEIKNIRVEMTILDGKVEWERA